MNSINCLTTRAHSTSIEKTQTEAITSARIFSSMNARSCEQKPQTCHENKASSSIENTVNDAVPSYLRLRYRQGLAQYKIPHVVANESLFRHWLALVDNSDKWFNAEKKEVGTKLITYKTFRQALSKNMQNIFSQSHAQLNEKDYEILSSVIQQHYLLKGNFDFQSIFMDVRDNRQQLLNRLTQSFVKRLAINSNSMLESGEIDETNEIKEQAATQARNLINRFHSILDEHHGSGKLEKIQQQIETEFLKAFNYEVVNEKDLKTGKCKKDEFFVINEDNSYSMITLDNFFAPLHEPVDPDIYQRDKIENPSRDNPSAYFKTHFGEQILTYSKSQRHREREDDWGRIEEKDFAENIWKQAQENEKQTEKDPRTKARVNLNEIKRRDGLFSQKDAFESGVSLLLHPLERLNAAGEYWGFNTRPCIPRKNQDDNASSHRNEKNPFTHSKDWVLSSPKAVKNKPSSKDLFTFPAAKATPIVSKEKTLEERKTQEKYDNWYQKGIEKPESLLNRQKRVFKEGKITLDQIVKVSFEQYLGIASDPAFQNLRAILSRDISHWDPDANPDAARFQEIKAAIVGITKSSRYGADKLAFLLNTLGAFQMSAMENNQDFRRAYMFYMHETEKSLKEKEKFFYHADVEALFPSSYKAHATGINYFQQSNGAGSGTLLKNKAFNLYTLLLHTQSSGKSLNYKSLAMAFAHVDILHYTFNAHAFLKFTKKVDDTWSKIAKDTNAIGKMLPAIMQYAADNNRHYPPDLIAPIMIGQNFYKERFMTLNTQSIRGFCHYLTMSVMTALSDERNLDGIANVKETLEGFHKLSLSDPIIYFRVANFLENANAQLYHGSGFFPGSFTPVPADSIFKVLADNDQLAEMILTSKKHGFNIIVRTDITSHSIGVMPIKLGNNQVMHYYFDPIFGLLPCYCKEQLVESLKLTYGVLGVENVNDPNELSKVRIEFIKLNKRHLTFFGSLRTNCGFRFNELNKQILSKFANSHTLSNEDWSAFFPDFNKGEKLYNKDFDSLEGDLVYKALKTDTSLLALSHLYVKGLKNLPINPINLAALSSATISEILERERLSATADQGSYHDAAQALESEVRRNQGAPLLPASSQDAISGGGKLSDSLENLSTKDLLGGDPSNSRLSDSLEDLVVEDLFDSDPDRNRFSVSLGDQLVEKILDGNSDISLADFFDNPPPPSRTSAQNLGQSILNSVVEREQNQASLATSRRSRVRNAFTSHFQRLGRGREALEAEFKAMSPHSTPTTIGRFLDEVSQENISEADLDAIDLETHKINQQVNQINMKVAEILQTKGLQASDFRFSPAENVGAAGTILLHQIDNPTEKLNIDLSERPKLASIWKEVKAVINGRTHNFVAAMTSHLSSAQRTSILGSGWKAVGRASDTGSKFLSLYALTTLGDESHFFQQSHLASGEKVLNILTMADLVLDNGSNAAGFANSLIKRLFASSSTLSKISRFTGKASNAVSLVVQGFELGFYAYAYKHAESKMEREIAKLMVVSKSFQTALTVVTIAACAAAPPLAPIFMTLGLFIAYVENAALTKTISKETANALFQQFAGELEFMRKLLENPELLFNEEENQITVVSAAMPYSKLVVTADSIQMERNAEPFAVEFTETFRQTVEQYKSIVFREPGTHAGSQSVFDYSNMPTEYQDYKEMLQHFGRGFKQGFFISPKNDDIGEFTAPHENSRQHFINQHTHNGTFNEEIAQRQIVVGNIAQCLTQEAEKAAPIYAHTFKESNKTQHIVIQGHPVRPIYQSTGCTQGEVDHYSYAPRWNEITNLDQCDTKPDGSTKSGNFWKTRRVKDIYRHTEKDAAPKLYKGKLAFKESSNMPHLKPGSAININQWNLETSWKAQTCYESPDNVKVEIGSPQYVLSSGGALPNIYHFPQDEFAENVKRLHLGEEDDLEAQVAGSQVYGLYSSFPISDSNVDEKGSWFDITLVPDGNSFLHLYPNTYLNISEQETTETTPAKGDIHLMIPYKTLRLNGIGFGKKAIVGNKKASDKKELVFLPETNQPIHIKLDESVKRTVNVDIIKELPNKSTATCGVLVSQDEKGSLSLALNQISQVPLGNIASTTTFVSNQIQELKGVVPDLTTKAVRVHGLDLSKTPYHQEKALETSPLPLAPIWEKVFNQTSTTALNQTLTDTFNQTLTDTFNQTLTDTFNQTLTDTFNQTLTDTFNQTLTDTFNQTLTEASSKNKTEFVSTGWYFAPDENIKDHPAVQKNTGLLVPKIWRSDLPSKVQDIIHRMAFAGFARESMDTVPEDVKSAIADQDECFSYHFFDPQTGLMIKQWGASEIRFWDSRDIVQCSPDRIPQKVFWSGSETENYTCDVVNISPPTETMGGAQGRAAIMVEGDSSKLELANSGTNKKFLNYIFDKSLSALIQRAKADPDWNPDESDLDLQNLMIHVKDIKVKYKDQSTAPVQAFLLHDKEPKLALVSEGEGLLAIPKMQDYAITAARAEASGTDAKPTYKLFKRPLIKGEAYEKINEQLTNGTLTIDEADLTQKSEIKPEFQFVGIKNAPLESAIICHASEGIAMMLNYDLENTKLLGVNNDYLTSKNISLNEETNILAEYQSLVNRIGSSAFAYINLYQGDENNPDQPSIYVNTKTAIPTLIYVPVFYYERTQGSQTVKKQALSKKLVVLSDTNDIAGQTKKAVVQDVAAKKIYTVWRSDNAHSSLGDVFPYTYVWHSENTAFIGLEQHAHTPFNDVELPKMNLDRLFLLPCDKQAQKRVELKDWMLRRLNTLTLGKPIHSNDYVQQILLTPSQLTAVNATKPLITKDVLGRLQLSLLMATQNQEVREGSELIRINLENAVSADGQLDPAFADSVKLHKTTLDLQQLANEAYAEYLKIVV